MIKYLVLFSLIFSLKLSIASTPADSIPNIFEPVKIFSGERIAMTEDSLKKIIIDTNAVIINDFNVYYDTVGDVIRIFQFNNHKDFIQIESRLYGDKLYGFFLQKNNDWECIRLYEMDTVICEAVIVKEKLQLEYFRNGNIFVRRVYNKNGEIQNESIDNNDCKVRSIYHSRHGILKSESKIYHICNGDLIKYYSYTNFPPLKWLKSFAGIEINFLQKLPAGRSF